jgi:peptide/nickel transport system substrate-binding protein
MHNAAYGKGADLDKVDLKPYLAQEMRPAPDYSYYDFVIPREVFYHNIPPVNGRRVTAEDVKYVFDYYRSPNSIFSAPLRDIDRVEVVGADVVRFHMKAPFLDFPYTLAGPQLWIFAPEHHQGEKQYWEQQPIGTGPFMVVKSEPGKLLEQVRHEEYRMRGRRDDPRWPGVPLPFLAKETGFVLEATASIASFRSGQTDHFGATDPQQIEDLLITNPDAKVQLSFHTGGTHSKMVLQHKNPILADVRVRRAISMALNRREIITLVYGGLAGFGAPIGWDALEYPAPLDLADLGPYLQYNPEESRRLLTEAGYPGGFELEFLLSGAPDGGHLGIQKMLADVGIRVVFRQVESVVLTNLYTTKDFPGYVEIGANAPGMSGLWEAEVMYAPDAATNYGSINDTVMNDLLARARKTLDHDEQVRLLREIAARDLDQCFYIWLESRHRSEIMQPWLWNMAAHVRGRPVAFGSWSVTLAWIDDRAPAGRGGRKAV